MRIFSDKIKRTRKQFSGVLSAVSIGRSNSASPGGPFSGPYKNQLRKTFETFETSERRFWLQAVEIISIAIQE